MISSSVVWYCRSCWTLQNCKNHKLAHTFLSFPVSIPWHTSTEQYIHLLLQLAACFTLDHAKWWAFNRHFHGNPTERVNPTDGWQIPLWPEILVQCSFYTSVFGISNEPELDLKICQGLYWCKMYVPGLCQNVVQDLQLYTASHQRKVIWIFFFHKALAPRLF